MGLDIRGCGTALVTPFSNDGTLDVDALRDLVEFQLSEGIDFLVPCGTTGEAPTLEHEEYLGVVRVVAQEAKGKVPVIAGAGGNNTRKICSLVQELQALGVQGILSVAPYYNKPTQEGLYQHFKAIAESTDLPVILYNVPSRTSSNIEPATVARLAEIPNIIGIKEASGSITQQMEVLRLVPPGFKVLSGDDAFTFPLMAVGGAGVISVVSNEIPRQMTELTHLLLDGKYDEARKLNMKLLPLMQANFIETNPIPVKAALAMMGKIKEVYRLPMCPMKPENRARLEKVLVEQGLLQTQKV
ncbi:MAG TPA: 4-hydroxy-tetrahydrodipicolinate synthase [Terriglobia bacterium]|jgi:4-hydroxy-tetrahydrodipicolinate synthase|nr:4-hydroxy-tetrahydrodipicolinate synthase [Terriglobia bacterium]